MEFDERFLGAVLGVLTISDHGPGDPVGPLLVPLDQEVESARLAIRHTPAQRFIGLLHGLVPVRSSHTLMHAT